MLGSFELTGEELLGVLDSVLQYNGMELQGVAFFDAAGAEILPARVLLRHSQAGLKVRVQPESENTLAKMLAEVRGSYAMAVVPQAAGADSPAGQ